MRRNPDLSGTNASTATSTTNPLTSFGIWVAVRVRPFNKMELGSATEAPQPVAEMESDRKTMLLLDPNNGFRERATFTFDFCFSPFLPAIVFGTNDGKDESSDDDESAAERAQAEIYQAMGSPIVNSAWQGYNSCIFAYGQTSSGKSYTMMGTKRDPGIIPRLCRELFERIETETRTNEAEGGRKLVKVSLSYMEIYNEKVKDLLKGKVKQDARRQYRSRFDSQGVDDDFQQLRVRQHPLHGPFVEGLTKVDVGTWLECIQYIRQGNERRSQCATSMNENSSRSHAIFQLVVTQTEALGAKVRGKEVVNHKVSKINLVDLAGSERITRTHVTGKHLTEANSINQSLSTLRKVIDALVKKKPGQAIVIPYRESLLTWILADNFGGNSKTAMIANISPHQGNFAENESTLRYATLAKGIVNRVRVNEDPSAKLIRELQSQLKQLQSELGKGAAEGHVKDLEEEMEENKKAMEELLAREEGMRVLIQESREREEQLRVEKETLEKDQQHWRTEAERLQREKEALKAQLKQLTTQQGGETQAAAAEAVAELEAEERERVSKRKMSVSAKKNFWLNTVDDVTDDAPENEEESCPPHQKSLVRRRQSTQRLTREESELPFLKTDNSASVTGVHPATDDGAPREAREDVDGGNLEPPSRTPDAPAESKGGTIKARKRAERAPAPWVAEDASPDSAAHKDEVPSTAGDGSAVSPARTSSTPSTPTPAAFGRRAATQENGERQPVTNDAPQPAVRTAGAGGRRRNNDPATSPTPPAVPPSLAHLVGSPQRKTAQPDALDSFLSGGGTQAPAPRERGKPWKPTRRTPSSQSSTPASM